MCDNGMDLARFAGHKTIHGCVYSRNGNEQCVDSVQKSQEWQG